VTDASAKDAALAANVVALAGAKKIRVTALLFGSCSPIDPAYLRVADETGGRVFLEGAPGAAAAAGLVRPRLEGDDATIGLARGELRGGTVDVAVPVDAGVSRLTVPVTTALADVDFFSFAGTSGAQVAAEVSASRIGSPLDAALMLLDSDGATVLDQSDDAFGLDPRVAARLTHDGTFL